MNASKPSEHIHHLRNLLLGYELRRVFPTCVGPGSPSRDAANCLSSRFNRLVETRRRYGWLRMVFPRCTPLPSSNLVPFGRWWHARGREHCRGGPGSALSGKYAPDSARAEAARSSTSQEIIGPLCARIKGADREVSEGKADL